MFTLAETSRNRVQRALAWIGLLLMVVSVTWLELLPKKQGPAKGNDSLARLEGPISRVIIDPGHGGNDSGAMREGVLEKDLTLDVARRVDLLLRMRGLTTMLTRAGDETVSLAARAEAANEERDCVFVSIHFDEGGRAAATGVQTFYATRQASARPLLASWLPFLQRVSSTANNLESQSLAGFIQDEMVVRTQAFNRGTTAEQFYVIANVRHPAVLVEGGFLSNNDDLAKLTNDGYRQQLAVAISDGIMRYREIANQPEPASALGEPGS